MFLTEREKHHLGSCRLPEPFPYLEYHGQFLMLESVSFTLFCWEQFLKKVIKIFGAFWIGVRVRLFSMF